MNHPRDAVVDRMSAATLLGAAAWATSWSWAPLVAQPHRYLLPGGVLVALVVLVGAALRTRVPILLLLGAQLLVAAGTLVAWFAPLAGVSRLPGPHSVARVVHLAVTGAQQVNTYAAPVPTRYAATAAFLAACTAGLALGVDLVGVTLRLVPAVALVLLVALSVPISVLVQDLSPGVFVAVAVSLLAALALDHAQRTRAWGRPGGPTGGAALVRRAPVAAPVIGAAAVLGAVLVAGIAPVPASVFAPGSPRRGTGDGDVTLTNPMLDIRRDLLEQAHLPLVMVETDDPDPSYLQLAVLDDFTGDLWQASPRALPPGNRADGELPPAPGIGPTHSGRPTHWQLTLAPAFQTRWLPVPTPTRALDVTGDWRYDARTLDVVDVAPDGASGALSYRATADRVRLDATRLARAGAPVGIPTDGMTALPPDLPPALARVARRVTRGAHTEYQQALDLQDWFRSRGHFTYSTAAAPGTGSALLARFVTTDRVGYCEQFSTAMAVLARTLGIPSRVVVGFLRPTGASPGAAVRVFTSDDLHAWPELYFSGSGWVRFEPTPGTRSGAPPSFTHQPVRPLPTARPSTLPRPSGRPAPAPHRAPAPTHHRTARPSSTQAPWTAASVVALLALLLALPRLERRRRRRRWLSGDADDRHLAHGVWQELRATALDHGLGWPDGASPRRQAAHLRARVSSELEDVAALDRITAFVERERYGRPATASPEQRAVLLADAERWRARARDAVSPRTARRARWWPPSLVERPAAPPVLEEERVETRS